MITREEEMSREGGRRKREEGRRKREGVGSRGARLAPVQQVVSNK
jgi:hypothetical protein